MSDIYELVLAGADPVSVTDMKAYMKVTSSSDDVLIAEMLGAATTWGQNYTGREFTDNTWKMLFDEFVDRIVINRDPLNRTASTSILSVKHLVSDILVTVAASTYYLKKNTQNSELLLNDGESWPTDTDDREQAVEVNFITESYRDVEAIASAIKRHVAYWYKNRGDCGGDGACTCDQAAKGSGVTSIYDQFRIARV